MNESMRTELDVTIDTLSAELDQSPTRAAHALEVTLDDLDRGKDSRLWNEALAGAEAEVEEQIRAGRRGLTDIAGRPSRGTIHTLAAGKLHELGRCAQDHYEISLRVRAITGEDQS